MSATVRKMETSRRIVHLKQVMQGWRALGLRRWSSARRGSVVVYVGPDRRRFLVPARFLNLPVFAALLERVEEEYGFQPAGGLAIPCDPEFFGWVLDALGRDLPRFGPLDLEALLALFATAHGDAAASACRGAVPYNDFSPFLQSLGHESCLLCLWESEGRKEGAHIHPCDPPHWD